ncbi:nucleoside-diphosphate sugar epimerase/dehydratase [Conexibacter sp. DBS9H8]|uniref:nucleoside-diphosphate sugar epimerase/dehydratase n=1 Tax=Conexibacter sp. DBS9H8 TaxID=2937801 RepID=UPI00200E4A91|nr:nucleoside-diphosphate sugar epimerase/dehydratase [Conexibacter sp. DBS9H8]
MRWRIRPGALPVHRHSLPQLVADGLLVAFSYLIAFELRFDGHLHGQFARYGHLLADTIWWVVPLLLVVLAGFSAYERGWSYITQRDYEAVVKATVVGVLLVVGGVDIFRPVAYVPEHGLFSSPVELPLSVIALFLLITLVLLIGVRFGVHLVREGRVGGIRSVKGAREVLIVGAGDGGHLVVRELARNPELRLRPIGFIDDDPRKQRFKDEHGLRVLGRTEPTELARVLDDVEPDEVIIAIPSAPGQVRANVVTACRRRGIPVRTLPTVFELLQHAPGRGGYARQLREVQVEDILGRESVVMNVERVGRYLAGKVVMVTGAGGSIGSELCRQISLVNPSRLILVDHAEDNLFQIARELEEERHVNVCVPVLADCKEEERMREVLAEHRPAVIFHAAAYKHVAMMELNPVEAVRNNALATRLMTVAAGEFDVETFVLISTDKAVKPATVMGASKALAEWAVEAAAVRFPATHYASVRFGNVLGSSGSVVPIFRRQIAAGGPVTVTDPRMQRYFMTIPEAVQLVIRAGSMRAGAPFAGIAGPGTAPVAAAPGSDVELRRDEPGPADVFVLEMGEPVRILELAETMIRLSGFEPGRDIAIEIVGARPGEKYDEELFNVYETPQPTAAQKILRADRHPLDPATVEAIFDTVNLLVLEGDAAALAAHVSRLDTLRAAAVPGSVAPSP